MGHQSRRRSPACALCRSRKLRCNRGSPCSNCSIRGVPCNLDGSRSPRGIGIQAGSEAVAAGGSQEDSLAPPPITFRTRAISAISSPSYFILHPASSPPLTEEVRVVKCICLPLRRDAHVLLDKFIKDVLHFHHIFHTPSLPSTVDRFYDAVEQGKTVDLGQLMLILAICCSSTHTWTRYDDSRGLFRRSEDANSQTAGWLLTALDVIHHAHLSAHASMAFVQGIIVVFFMLCSLEGISARARLLHAQAVAMAQEIGLHFIDSPNNSNQHGGTLQTPIGEAFCVCPMISRLSVPQQGAYTILPSQMAVRKPCNANDQDIIEGREIVDRPPEEATSVSYLLQRTRLAELFYSLGSHDKPINWSAEDIDYGKIMEADMKLRQFMRELPSFFRLEKISSLSKLPPSDIRRSSDITIQRYMLNMIFYGQICKLHLPYLAQGTLIPGFAYSHDSCLKAAQRIIYVEHRMRTENSTFILFRQRMNVKFRSIFIACVVFVLDGCLTTSTEGSTTGGDATMTDAWRVLYETKEQSPLASELLHLSIKILRKYRASHPALEALRREGCNKESAPLNQTGPMDVGATGSTNLDREPERVDAEADNIDLDKLWETLQGRGRDWNNLFWSLGPPMI
ncbi:hypothetical protein V8C35DRAFT_321203 [Trichoderma chlorosporum]